MSSYQIEKDYSIVTKLYCGHYMQVPGFNDHLSIKATTEWPKHGHRSHYSFYFWTPGPE